MLAPTGLESSDLPGPDCHSRQSWALPLAINAPTLQVHMYPIYSTTMRTCQHAGVMTGTSCMHPVHVLSPDTSQAWGGVWQCPGLCLLVTVINAKQTARRCVRPTLILPPSCIQLPCPCSCEAKGLSVALPLGRLLRGLVLEVLVLQVPG